VDGVFHAVPHPTHVAKLLGIPTDPRHGPERVAADLVRVLDAWLEVIRSAPWQLLLEPTPSRGRTSRELVVNVFKFVDLLPEAWETGEWNGALEVGMDRWLAEEERVEMTLTDRGKVEAYAEPIRDAVATFFDGVESELGASESRFILNAGGGLAYPDVLDGQRIHAAQHYRQVATHLHSRGTPVPMDALEGLPLPRRIY
jgi:hypothetical protein